MSDEIRIYVADIAAYNDGILHGIWIDATKEAKEILADVEAMLACSPEPNAVEWAIHDYENFGRGNISEYESFESVHEKALFIEEHGELGKAVLSHWCGDVEDAQSAMGDSYYGIYESLADYMQELTEETTKVPNHLEFYIDYERMARDMEMGGQLYAIETGYKQVHVFWN